MLYEFLAFCVKTKSNEKQTNLCLKNIGIPNKKFLNLDHLKKMGYLRSKNRFSRKVKVPAFSRLFVVVANPKQVNKQNYAMMLNKIRNMELGKFLL